MFKFLKEKLKRAIDKISKDVEEVPDEEVQEDSSKEISLKSDKKKEGKKEGKKEEKKEEEKKEEKKEEEKKEEKKEEEKKEGFFQKIKKKISTKTISESKFDELFSELEIVLLENNVAYGVVEKIKLDLKNEIVDCPIKRNEISDKIVNTLRNSISSLLDFDDPNILEKIKEKSSKPYVVCFVGVNGCGKTTSVAKFANYLKNKGLEVLLVAGDTWRAASIQQLEEHANNLKLRIIKHNYGSDPAAVAFDGIKAAKANNVDVVLIDTAGRQHSNKDLMRELEKIIRVAVPDLKIFVGESITGNDCIMQAKEFAKSVDFDGVILTKSDIDKKGGAAISVEYVTGKPIFYIGTGQEYDDFEKFDPQKILDSLDL